MKRGVHLIMHIDGLCYDLRVCAVANSVRGLQILLSTMFPVVCGCVCDTMLLGTHLARTATPVGPELVRS